MSGTDYEFYKGHTKLGPDIVLYQNSTTANGNWYVRILMKNEAGYLRRSTKTPDKTKATRIAWNIYNDVKEKEWFGITYKKIPFTQVVKAYIDANQQLSPSRIIQLNAWTRRYIIPYFSHLTLDTLHEHQQYIDDYPIWRLDYWNSYDQNVKLGTQEEERYSGNGEKPRWLKGSPRPVAYHKKKPSRKTIRAEIILYNAIINYAVEKGWMKKAIHCSYERLPDTEPRSQSIYTFRDDEIATIRNHFVQQYRKGKQKKLTISGKPILDAEGMPTYILYTQAHHPEQKHMWVNMRGWFYMAINTGMRVQEINSITWADIRHSSTQQKDGTTLHYLVFTVKETKSARKDRLFRIVYAPHHLTRILNEVRTQNAPHNKDSDFVFAMRDGKKYLNITRYQWRTLLKKLGVFHHPSGATRSAKHFRSYWASKALQTKPIHIVASAMGNSIRATYEFYAKLEIAKTAYKILSDMRQPDNVIQLMQVVDDE